MFSVSVCKYRDFLVILCNYLAATAAEMKKNVLILVAALLLSACGPRDRFIQVSGYAQGGVYTVKVNLKGVSVTPEEIRDSVDAILVRIDTTLSGYNPASQLSRFNAGETIRPNDLFLDMYERAWSFYRRSDGALDFAAGPLFDAWGFGFREEGAPLSDGQIAAILASCGMHRLREDIRSAIAPDGTLSAAELLLPDTGETLPRLNYNAIAQGWSCDLVAAWLRTHGARNFLVNIGEIYCEGLGPGGDGWTVGIDRPFEGNESPGEYLEGIWSSQGAACGIVTSGNYRKYAVDSDGSKRVHTIDPRTGRPVISDLLSATVTAPTAAEADALATWCMVIGKEAASELINSLGEGYSCYLIYEKDGGMVAAPSSGFTLIER